MLTSDVLDHTDPLRSQLAAYFQACVDDHEALQAEIAEHTSRSRARQFVLQGDVAPPAARHRVRERETQDANILEPHEARNAVWQYARTNLTRYPVAAVLQFVQNMLSVTHGESFCEAELTSLMEAARSSM